MSRMECSEELSRQPSPSVAGWKHRALSFMEKGVTSIPKDRGAERGDVDGPLVCSLALGVSRSLKLNYLLRVPWIGVNSQEEWQ